jgi:hypothetical protein
MPLKGMNKVKANTAKFIDKVNSKHEKVLTEIGGLVISYAKFYVPLDTGNLLNSDFRQVFQDYDDVWTLTVGFTANYALPLHGTDTYTPLWKPRPVGAKVYDQGKGKPPRIKSAVNNDATPQFLSRGIDDAMDGIMKIVEHEYRNV